MELEVPELSQVKSYKSWQMEAYAVAQALARPTLSELKQLLWQLGQLWEHYGRKEQQPSRQRSYQRLAAG